MAGAPLRRKRARKRRTGTSKRTKGSSLVFLTGFSGSGKSTIGPLFARSLGYGFTDLDSVIESVAGKSVDRLFAENGEDFFRDFEYGVLENLVDRTGQVVSLSGGVLEDDRSLTLVKRSGTLINLKASPEILASRLRDKTDRPLMKGDDRETFPEGGFEKRIESMLERRKPRNLQADVVVSIGSEAADVVVKGLTERIVSIR